MKFENNNGDVKGLRNDKRSQRKAKDNLGSPFLSISEEGVKIKKTPKRQPQKKITEIIYKKNTKPEPNPYKPINLYPEDGPRRIKNIHGEMHKLSKQDINSLLEILFGINIHEKESNAESGSDSNINEGKQKNFDEKKFDIDDVNRLLSDSSIDPLTEYAKINKKLNEPEVNSQTDNLPELNRQLLEARQGIIMKLLKANSGEFSVFEKICNDIENVSHKTDPMLIRDKMLKAQALYEKMLESLLLEKSKSYRQVRNALDNPRASDNTKILNEMLSNVEGLKNEIINDLIDETVKSESKHNDIDLSAGENHKIDLQKEYKALWKRVDDPRYNDNPIELERIKDKMLALKDEVIFSLMPDEWEEKKEYKLLSDKLDNPKSSDNAVELNKARKKIGELWNELTDKLLVSKSSEFKKIYELLNNPRSNSDAKKIILLRENYDSIKSDLLDQLAIGTDINGAKINLKDLERKQDSENNKLENVKAEDISMDGGEIIELTDEVPDKKIKDEIIELTDEVKKGEDALGKKEDEIIDLVDEIKTNENETQNMVEAEIVGESDEWDMIESEFEEVVKNDPKMRLMLQQEKENLDKLSPAEKKKWYEWIGDLGYGISEKKNTVLSEMIGWIGKRFGKKNILGLYFEKYSGIYAKSAANDKKSRESAQKSLLSISAGTGRGSGVLMKYGRVAYDLYDSVKNGSINPLSLKSFNPFRNVSSAAMFIGRSSEALKEARMESESVIENTRVKDEQQAMEEAWDIYNKLQEQNGGKMPSAEQLQTEYKRGLPKDIQKRFARGDFKQTHWLKFYLSKSESVKYYADKLTKKLDRIENKTAKKISYLEKNLDLDDKTKNEAINKLLAEKETSTNELLARNEALINDLDRMVGNAGAIDAVVHASWMAEKSAKGVATAMMLDTARMLAQCAVNLHGAFEKYSDDRSKIPVGTIRHFTVDRNGGSAKVDHGEVGQEIKHFHVPADPGSAQTSGKIDLGTTEDGKKEAADTSYLRIKDDDGIQGNEETVFPSREFNSGKDSIGDVLVKNLENKPGTSKDNSQVFKQVIDGRVRTYTGALRGALKQATPEVQDKFIQKHLQNIEITNDNRQELIQKAINKVSISNLKTGDGNDVQNLVRKGNVGVLDKDGSFHIEKGTSAHDAKIVSEGRLRANTTRLNEHDRPSVHDYHLSQREEGKYETLKNNLNSLGSTQEASKNLKIAEENLNNINQTISDIEKIHQAERSQTMEKFGLPEKVFSQMDEPVQKEYYNFAVNHKEMFENQGMLEKVPQGLRGNHELALEYLKIHGNTNDKIPGIRNLLNLKNKEFSFVQDKKGLLTVEVSDPEAPKQILIDTANNKIGAKIKGQGEWGMKKTGPFGWGKKVPNEELTVDSIGKIKKLIGVSENDLPQAVAGDVNWKNGNINDFDSNDGNEYAGMKKVTLNGGEETKIPLPKKW